MIALKHFGTRKGLIWKALEPIDFAVVGNRQIHVWHAPPENGFVFSRLFRAISFLELPFEIEKKD